MSNQFYSLVTDIGIQEINKALSSGTKLDMKYIAVGDSNGEYYEPNASQTSLVNQKYKAEISEVTELTAKALIPFDVGGFFIREAGILDSKNQLLLIAKQPETYKPVEQEGSVKELWIKVLLKAINPDVIELKIDPNLLYATEEWVINLFNNHKHPELMAISQYDTNNNGIADSCDVVDGGSFTD